MRYGNPVLALAVPLVVLLGWPTGSDARIYRSCQAQYWVEFQQRDNNVSRSTIPLGGGWTARRGCGDLVPNRCRQRATDAIRKCVEVHWDFRWTDPGRPTHCTSAESVNSYPLTDIKRDLERAACCSSAGRGYSNVWVKLSIEIGGDVDCGGHNVRPVRFPVSSDRYYVDCGARRGDLC